MADARRVLFLGVVVCALLTAAGAAARPEASPRLSFSVFAQTGVQLGGIVWTGRQFVYVPEVTGALRAGDVTGRRVSGFAQVQPNGDEMRCVHLNRTHGFARGLYCHTPDNRILRLSDDGKAIDELARLPDDAAKSDGALAFDGGGKFGYTLLAVTGGSAIPGGEVYAIRSNGSVARVGGYAGPGGAENAAVAPAHFGPLSRQLLITIDDNDKSGRLLAMSPGGAVRTLVSGLQWGLNPITALTPRTDVGAAKHGLYLADYETKNVFFLPASRLRRYAGRVLVGTERAAMLYVVAYSGSRYRTTRLTTNLPSLAPSSNLESALFLSR